MEHFGVKNSIAGLIGRLSEGRSDPLVSLDLLSSHVRDK